MSEKPQAPLSTVSFSCSLGIWMEFALPEHAALTVSGLTFRTLYETERQPGDARWIVGNGTLNVPCGDFSINAVMFTVVLTKIKCWMLKALCLSWNNGEVGSFTFSFSLGGVLVPCREVPLAHTYVQKGVLWSKINDMLRWALSQGFQIMKVTLF